METAATGLAFDDVDGEAAAGGFLVLRRKRWTGSGWGEWRKRVAKWRTAGDVEAAGEGAFVGAAVADAFLHGDPDGVEALAGVGFRAELGFIGEGELGDGEAAGGAKGEEFGGAFVGKGNVLDGVDGRMIEFVFGGDEATAEGVDDVLAEDGVVVAKGEEVHAVGVAGEGLEAFEGEVGFFVEGEGAAVGEGEGSGGTDGF